MAAGSLQEVIMRARFVFSGAPKRRAVFDLVNGKRTAAEIARNIRRSRVSVLNDIKKLRDFGLVADRTDSKGNVVTKDGSTVFEKSRLAKHIPATYFLPVADTRSLEDRRQRSRESRGSSPAERHIPTEQEVLEICRGGENQLYEFKGPGTATDKIAKEVAAFLHTRRGGIILYGVDDDGTILGSEVKSQVFDQKIQNSVRNTISPPPSITVTKRNVMGAEIQLVIVPAWDARSLYQYNDGRYYVRKGTNVFAMKPNEITRLSKGEFID
jgi:predicted HTH transcriptional regulator